MYNENMKVTSVNLASGRGRKFARESIDLKPGGVEGDVHFGSKDRQVSLLGENRIQELQTITGAPDFEAGAFAENITCSYLDDLQVQRLDRFAIGETLLEVTSIGKPLHKEVDMVGHYVSPHFAVFCRVLKSGTVKAGDEIIWQPKIFRAKIITLSDRAADGVYKDKSGPLIVDQLENFFEKESLRFSADYKVIPDDEDKLIQTLQQARGSDIIMCTGGTGLGETDITPETVQPMLDKELPGIMEYIRVRFGAENPAALLSRSVAGTMGESLVYTLPGSPKAVDEYMSVILKTLTHSLWMLNGLDAH